MRDPDQTTPTTKALARGLLRRGISAHEIAKAYDLPEGYIESLRNYEPKGVGRPKADPERDRMIYDLVESTSLRKASEELGIIKETVRAARQRHIKRLEQALQEAMDQPDTAKQIYEVDRALMQKEWGV